jgi:predicted permease
MSRLDGWLHRLRVRLRGEAYAREQAEEIDVHLALEAMHQRHGGAAAEEAAMAARRRFGNVTYYRERSRDAAGFRLVDRLRQDLTYAWRGWRRTPGTAVAIVITFALGVGANGAIFSFLDRVLLRPPARVLDPDDVRRLYVARPNPQASQAAAVNIGFSYPEYAAIRDAVRDDARIAALLGADSTSTVQGGEERPLRRAFVTADYLPLLLGTPARGRFFTADEDGLDAPAPVAVLTDAGWARLFASDSTVIGRTIALGGVRFEVVGVTPAGFSGLDLEAPDIFVPAAWRHAEDREGRRWYQRQDRYIDVVARLAPHANDTRVADVASVALRGAVDQRARSDSGLRVLLGSVLRERGPMGKERETAIAIRLIGIAGILLCIACANITNLLLARAARRRREVAIRLALGVSRRRLVGQLLAESLVLAVVAGAVGVVVAGVGGTVLRTQLQPRIHWSGSALDPSVAVVAFGAALLCGLAAGLVPALVASRQDVGDALKAAGHSGAPSRSRLRAALLVTQAALSVVLLAGAAVFLRSLHNVRTVDLGFDPNRVVVAGVDFTDSRRHPELVDGLSAVAKRLRGVPGVERVALASGAPLVSTMWMPLRSPGVDTIRWVNDQPPELVSVSGEYFAALGMRIVSGRAFAERDDAHAPLVAVVNQTMARALWPNANAVGKCLVYGPPTNPCVTVVGIVSDVRNWGLGRRTAMTWYLPLAQTAWLPHALVVRAAPERAAAVTALLRRDIRAAFAGAVVGVAPLEARLEPHNRPRRLSASLFTAFGLLALLVAGVGVYGVASCAYTERLHELGVRVALGAAPRDLTRLVLGSGLRVVGVGVVAGGLLALALSRLIASLLYDVSAHDPLSIGAAALLLCVTGVVAALPPAWRAARVDPVAVLREE